MGSPHHNQVTQLLIKRSKSLLQQSFVLILCAFLLLTIFACTPDRQDSLFTVPSALPPLKTVKIEPPETAIPTPTTMETFRTLSPPTGLKFTPLFANPVKNPNARVKRLEGSVQTLRNDFDTVVPTLVRMATLEKDIRELVVQLQILTKQNLNNAEQPDISTSPVARKTAYKKKLPSEIRIHAPSNTSPSIKKQQTKPVIGNVKSIRFGDHANKTRIVLDMTAKININALIKFKNNGKTLILDLSQINWAGKRSWNAIYAQLISSYYVEKNNLYVNLMYASQIKTLKLLSPSKDSKNYRLVIDLFSPEIHKNG